MLLHLSSLPGGKLGREAFRFVDWLVEAGQSWWALLPLGPPDWAGSPYSSSSAFATHGGYLEKPRARVTASELEDFAGSTTGPATGRRSQARMRFPTRSGSTVSGARSADTPPTAAYGCSGTSRSTSPRAGPTPQRIQSSFRRAGSPARRRTR